MHIFLVSVSAVLVRAEIWERALFKEFQAFWGKSGLPTVLEKLDGAKSEYDGYQSQFSVLSPNFAFVRNTPKYAKRPQNDQNDRYKGRKDILKYS